MSVGETKSVNDIRTAIRELSARAELARKEGRPDDAAELDSPPEARGIRLLPPGDPYLQKINRPLLAPDRALRSKLFHQASALPLLPVVRAWATTAPFTASDRMWS